MDNKSVNYAHYIDHTLLKMDATKDEIIHLCDEAKTYHFFSVCVNSGYVPLAAKTLAASDVKICSVIGFPLGAGLTDAKVCETRSAVVAGADEIDMVMNVGWFKSGDRQAVKNDICAVKTACGEALLKVILEIHLLSAEEIKQACLICREAEVDFVKTSTGFSGGGATEAAVRLMCKTVGNTIGVKASGGIRDRKTAQAMIDIGANRLGTSSGIAIVTDRSASTGQY